jgi:SAM-dependent methyltransferase
VQIGHADVEAEEARAERQLRYLGRLIDLETPRDVLVTGCGPQPTLVRYLAQRGHRATGLEVVPDYVTEAREFLGELPGTIVEATAEDMPFPDGSFDLAWSESVLEHVEAPERVIGELARVLRPGGVAVVTTTNRLRVLPEPSGEFDVPWFHWLPAIVRESYVFEHLHHRPSLARYTSRPAVHWFSYAELCRLGRSAGFAWFYSWLDLVDASDEVVARSAFRRAVIRGMQRSPWVRALALTQVGDTVLMRKRPGGA